MAIYLAGNPITITWVLEPTDNPLPEAEYDISFVPSTLEGTYTDSAIENYVAPTAITAGSLTYTFTPTKRGLHTCVLTCGIDEAYLELDEKYFWIFANSPGSLPSTEVLGALSYPSPEITIDARRSTWGLGRIDGAGYDGDDTILFGHAALLNYFLYSTDSLLSTPTLAFDLSDLPGSPTSYANQIEYSPLLGIWVMALAGTTTGGIPLYSCSGDPTVMGNWTQAPLPTEWSVGGFTSLNRLWWNPSLELFFLGVRTNFLRKHMQVSNDGINWQAWDDYQVIGGTEPDEVWSFIDCDIGGQPWHMVNQEEAYAFKRNNTDAGTFPGAANGYTKTYNNGVLGGAGQRSLHHVATDGTAIVVSTNQNINASIDPWNHSTTQNFDPNGWGPDGRDNLGWVDTDMGWPTTQGNRTLMLHVPKLARPWVVFHSQGSGLLINAGWFDAESIVASPTPSAGNAPQFARCTVEPFASMDALYQASFWNNVVLNGLQGTFSGQYQMRYNTDSAYGTNGYLIVASAGGTSTRDDDYLVFQKPTG